MRKIYYKQPATHGRSRFRDLTFSWLKKLNQLHFFAVTAGLGLFLGLLITIPFLSKKAQEKPTFQRNYLSQWDYQAQLAYGITTSLSKTNTSARVEVKRNNAKINFEIPVGKLTQTLTNAANTIVYASENQNLHVEYSLIPNGIKENIKLFAVPDDYTFVSRLQTDNLTAKKNGSNLPVFFNSETGEYEFHLERPFAEDAAGNRTYQVSYELKPVQPTKDFLSPVLGEKDFQTVTFSHEKTLLGKPETVSAVTDQFELVLTVDPDWLYSSERQYPINIDPTVVHDTTSEFSGGQFNRISDRGNGDTPDLETWYQANPDDPFTIVLLHMDETSDNSCTGGEDICDSSGNDFDGTFNGDAALTGSGHIGDNSITLDGTGDYVSISDTGDVISVTGSMTVEAWVNPTSLSGNNSTYGAGIINSITANPENIGDFMLGINDSGAIKFSRWRNAGADTDGTVTTQTGLVPEGEWTHIAAVYDESNTIYHIYVNGVEVEVIGATSTGTGWGEQVTIGRLFSGTQYEFNGLIDELRISHYARTADEIKKSAQRRGYGVYQSDTIDLGTTPLVSYDNLIWDVAGDSTEDGETATASATSDIVAQWNFNETSGTTADNAEGTSALDGTLTGFSSTGSQDAAPLSGWTSDNRRWGAGALMFDGGTDYVTVADNAALDISGAITVEAWVNPAVIGTDQKILDKWTDTTQAYVLGFDNTFDDRFTFGAAGTLLDSITEIKPGGWYHVVGTFDEGTNDMNIYINGKLDNTTSNAGTIPNSAQELNIGANNNASPGNFLKGTIDSTRLYDRALTPAEVLSNYNAARIEMQTRSSSDASTWSSWTPTGSETAVEDFETASNFTLPEEKASLSWIKDNNGISSATCDLNCDGGGRLPPGSSGYGDDLHTLKGSVIKDGSTYKMWYAASDGTNNRIYYAESSDGLAWVKYDNITPGTCDTTCRGGGTLGLGSNTTGDDTHVAYPTVILDSGTYKMWYTGYDGANWRIFYATSPDGLTWTKENNASDGTCDGACGGDGRLGLGTNTTGDDVGVYAPTVILDGSTYKMWYSGYDGANWRIYYATSSDGLTWTKQNNAADGTCDGACGGGGRLGLGTATTGDDLHVYYPTVMLDGSTYKMWYDGNDGSIERIYYATSSDGLTWTKQNNAIPAVCDSICAGNGRIGLGNSGRGDDATIFSPSVILDGSTYKMWYSGYDGSASYRIYNATSSDGLTWVKTDNTIPGTCNDECDGHGRLNVGTSGTGDDVYAFAPSIMIDSTDNDTYKMWYGGYDGANLRIYYATSSAGLTWTKRNNTAVANCDGACGGDGRVGLGSNGRGDDFHVVYGSVILDGSTYKMWYSGYDGATYRIYYATSSDGLTWTKNDNTTASNCDTTCEGNGKLGLGSSGRGDDVWIFNPQVIKDGSTYRMWYTGYDGATYRIYGATSSDGLTWTKTDNTIPSASSSISTNGRIALGLSGRADDTHTYYQTVYQDEDGIFYMMYTGNDGSGNITPFMAQSIDGDTWHKVYPTLIGATSNGTADPGAGRLALGSSGTSDDGQIYAVGGVVQDGNDYKYYYSPYDGTASFRTSLAVMNAEVNWDINTSAETVIKTEGSNSLRIETESAYNDSHARAIWHLDETNGDNAGDDVFDATSYNNNGEFSGTNIATAVVDGIKGKAREFNGSDDDILVEDSLSLDPRKGWTTEAWIKTTTTSDSMLLRKYDTTSPFAGYAMRINLSAGKFSSWMGGTSWVSSTSNVNDGEWHYLVATSDSSFIRVYVDGVLETVSAQASNVRAPSDEELHIGNSGGSSLFYDGIMDEVKLSNTVLTRQEIALNYQMGRNLLINRTISSNDFSGSTKVPFYVAADRPGTYLEAAVSESSNASLQGDSNTLSYWKLDSVNQWWGYYDYSGNQNYAVHASGTYSPTKGVRGLAEYYNSASYTYVNRSLTDSIGSGSFTVEAWIRPDTFSGYGTTYGAGIFRSLSVSTGTTGDFALSVDDGGSLHFWNWRNVGADTDGIAYTADGVIPIDKWSYVVGVWDGSSNHIYVNGQEVPIAGTESTASGWGNYATIGSNFPGDAPNTFIGAIDEVRVSDTARSADEIRQTYDHHTRSHEITIDFGAKLDSGNLIANSGDTSFTIDATFYGAPNMGDNLYEEEKIIIKETVDDTEYLAQGDVTSVNVSTGAVTVDAWDAGSTFPSGGYTANASVFKWQLEYWDITEPLDSQINAITNLTLEVTDNVAGRTIFVDDLSKAGEYMDNPLGTSISSSVERYFQYRAIYQTFDESVSASLSAVTLDYTENEPPNTPSLDSPADTATNQSLTPVLQTTTTDPNSDNIQYRIQLCEDSGMSVNCQTFDQSASQTGWSGQNADSNTTYTSGTQGTYTVQTALDANTTYYWKSDAIDPSGSNSFGSTQGSAFSFTTTQAPTAPTSLEAEGQTNPTQVTDSTPEFTAIHNDPDGDPAVYYRIEVNTASDFTGTVMWDSGQTSMSSLADGVRSTAVSYAGTALDDDTTYYWRIRFWDDNGAEGTVSATANFTTDFLDPPSSCTLEKNATNTQIVINWTDSNTAETGYEVEKNTNGGGFSNLTTTAADATSHTDNAVSSGNTYAYRIRATDGEFTSTYCTTDTLDLEAGSFFFEGIGFEAVQIH